MDALIRSLEDARVRFIDRNKSRGNLHRPRQITTY